MNSIVVIIAILAAGGVHDGAVRVATYNIWELSAEKIDTVDASGHGANAQLRGAAEVIQRARPDILLINEIDYRSERNLAEQFRDRYLRVSQGGQEPLDFPHVFCAPVNTGLPTGKDLDNDGKSDGPGDAFGYGRYPGQYGMAILSRFPIDASAARTFQKLLWKDMPGNLMPDGSDGKPAWYNAEEAAILRISSKSHWDVPVHADKVTLHLLCSHPTPPVFDGDEDRNGRRNFDEIRFWIDYLTDGKAAAYIVDDAGRRGGLPPRTAFVILGDLNADPARDPGAYGQPAIRRLIEHPRVHDPEATSPGALGRNKPGPPYFLERKTCDFGRIDYTFCEKHLNIAGYGVVWPDPGEPESALVRDKTASSDHRLVWVDIEFPKLED